MAHGFPHTFRRVQHDSNPGLAEIEENFSFGQVIRGTAGSREGVSIRLAGLPEGNLALFAATLYVRISGDDSNVVQDWAGDFSVGSAPNTDFDLNDTGDADIIPATAFSAASGTKITDEIRAVSTGTQSGNIFDNTDGSLELNFNLLIDDNVVTDGQDAEFTITGRVHVRFTVLGDD